MKQNRFAMAALASAALLAGGAAQAYPLDGYESTGIRRLVEMKLASEGKFKDVKQPAGATLPLADVDLRLRGKTYDLPPPDAGFTAEVSALLGGDMKSYGLALLDVSDPDHPRYAEYAGDMKQNVGSVGKIVVVLALFQALADLYPDDVAARLRVLRTTTVTADAFSQSDHHTVRFYDPKANTLQRRTIRVGDQASLFEYLDWMLSPSSNSAAGMVMRDAMLLRHYGRAYPVPEDEIDRFFAQTPKKELADLFDKTFVEPITRSGLDATQLRQGSVFTAGGKRMAPGIGESYGTPRELMRYLLRMEQGRLVDEWSSREIKRLLYVTERRIRYASSPSLNDAAVYFKSGSLYSCKAGAGPCGEYRGNVKNYMNSIAVVETPATPREQMYMVTLLSNVLHKNSAYEHQVLGGRIQNLMATKKPPAAPAAAASGSASAAAR